MGEKLRKRKPNSAKEKEEVPTGTHEIGSHMTSKQKKLLGKLNNLIKLSELSKKNNQITTDTQTKYNEESEEPSGKQDPAGREQTDALKDTSNDVSRTKVPGVRYDVRL